MAYIYIKKIIEIIIYINHKNLLLFTTTKILINNKLDSQNF